MPNGEKHEGNRDSGKGSRTTAEPDPIGGDAAKAGARERVLGKTMDKGPAKENAEEAAPKEDCQELKEKFLRLAAEFDNYKKRAAQEAAQTKELGMAELVRPLLTVIDEFELTLIAASESNDKGLGKGVEMVYANLIDIMRKSGLKEIEAKEKFDPYVHEIVMAKESESKEGTIIGVVKKGYMFKDKLIRPSSVIVSSGPAAKASISKGETDPDGNENDV